MTRCLCHERPQFGMSAKCRAALVEELSPEGNGFNPGDVLRLSPVRAENSAGGSPAAAGFACHHGI